MPQTNCSKEKSIHFDKFQIKSYERKANVLSSLPEIFDQKGQKESKFSESLDWTQVETRESSKILLAEVSTRNPEKSVEDPQTSKSYGSIASSPSFGQKLNISMKKIKINPSDNRLILKDLISGDFSPNLREGVGSSGVDSGSRGSVGSVTSSSGSGLFPSDKQEFAGNLHEENEFHNEEFSGSELSDKQISGHRPRSHSLG